MAKRTASKVPPPSRELRSLAGAVLDRLTSRYREVNTALDYDDAWQLLVATVLSAQTTDANVNSVVPALFERYPNPEDLAAADPEEVEKIIYSTGYYRAKTRNIISLAQDLDRRFDGQVPRDLDALITLPGVGRKTASVVLAEVWGDPAIAVDTHVKRVSNRLGLTRSSDPKKIEFELKALYPQQEWAGISMRMIQFGRDVCNARTPRCWDCPLGDLCRYEDKTERPD